MANNGVDMAALPRGSKTEVDEMKVSHDLPVAGPAGYNLYPVVASGVNVYPVTHQHVVPTGIPVPVRGVVQVATPVGIPATHQHVHMPVAMPVGPTEKAVVATPVAAVIPPSDEESSDESSDEESTIGAAWMAAITPSDGESSDEEEPTPASSPSVPPTPVGGVGFGAGQGAGAGAGASESEPAPAPAPAVAPVEKEKKKNESGSVLSPADLVLALLTLLNTGYTRCPQLRSVLVLVQKAYQYVTKTGPTSIWRVMGDDAVPDCFLDYGYRNPGWVQINTLLATLEDGINALFEEQHADCGKPLDGVAIVCQHGLYSYRHELRIKLRTYRKKLIAEALKKDAEAKESLSRKRDAARRARALPVSVLTPCPGKENGMCYSLKATFPNMSQVRAAFPCCSEGQQECILKFSRLLNKDGKPLIKFVGSAEHHPEADSFVRGILGMRGVCADSLHSLHLFSSDDMKGINLPYYLAIKLPKITTKPDVARLYNKAYKQHRFSMKAVVELYEEYSDALEKLDRIAAASKSNTPILTAIKWVMMLLGYRKKYPFYPKTAALLTIAGSNLIWNVKKTSPVNGAMITAMRSGSLGNIFVNAVSEEAAAAMIKKAGNPDDRIKAECTEVNIDALEHALGGRKVEIHNVSSKDLPRYLDKNEDACGIDHSPMDGLFSDMRAGVKSGSKKKKPRGRRSKKGPGGWASSPPPTPTSGNPTTLRELFDMAKAGSGALAGLKLAPGGHSLASVYDIDLTQSKVEDEASKGDDGETEPFESPFVDHPYGVSFDRTALSPSKFRVEGIIKAFKQSPGTPYSHRVFLFPLKGFTEGIVGGSYHEANLKPEYRKALTPAFVEMGKNHASKIFRNVTDPVACVSVYINTKVRKSVFGEEFYSLSKVLRFYRNGKLAFTISRW